MQTTNHDSISFSSFSPWRAISLRRRDDFALIQLFVLKSIRTALVCNEPIPEMLTAAACELRGGARRDLFKIVQQIQSGVSLATACEQFPSLMDEETVLSIRLGEQLEILPDTLTELIELQHNRCLAKVHRPQSTKLYWLSVTYIYLSCCSFVLFFIAPTMKKMLQEFELGAPYVLQIVLRLADIAAMYWPLFFIVVLAMAINVISPRTERWILSLFGLLRHIRFYQSPYGITKKLMAVAIEKQRTLQKIFSTLAKYHYHSATRQRLLVARNDIELGTEPWKATQGSGLLKADEANFLRQYPDSRLQSYFLGQLADSDWRKRERLITFRTLLINPVLTLIFGGFVALFTVGFFSALISMIRSLAY